MSVRKAIYSDAPFIKLMMEKLGCKTSNSMLIMQLKDLFDGADHEVLVFDDKTEISAFAVVYMLPQLAFDGGPLIISYLCVDELCKEQSAVKTLESYITKLARQRKCERIQVHCASWHAGMQRFFLGQGYDEYPQYFIKPLVYVE